MIAFVLWLYGLLVISSLIMVIAWGDAAQQLWREFDGSLAELRWCKAFVIAAGLTLHATAMSVACAYRAFDVLVNARVELGSEVALQLVVLVVLASSKVMFVWAGSAEDRERYARWPWWAFLYAMMLWAATCALWGGAHY